MIHTAIYASMMAAGIVAPYEDLNLYLDLRELKKSLAIAYKMSERKHNELRNRT